MYHLLLLLFSTGMLFCNDIQPIDFIRVSTEVPDTSNELDNAYNYNDTYLNSAKELPEEKLNYEAAKFIAYWEGASHTERFEKGILQKV